MDLREAFNLLREFYPEFAQGEITLTFTSALNTELVFECELSSEKPIRVSVPGSMAPGVAFLRHVAERARFLADRAVADAERAERAAATAREKATALETRAAELDAMVPRERDGKAVTT